MNKLLISLLLIVLPSQADLINPAPSTSPSPLPLVQLQKLERSKIRGIANMDYLKLRQDTNTLFTEVWNNPSGLTPQQVFDSLGTDAGQLHAAYLGIGAFLNGVSPGSLSLVEPKTVTVNSDGTVTVSP